MPLIVKIGLPVVMISVGSSLFLQAAVVEELRSRCAAMTTAVELCGERGALGEVGQQVVLVATDATALQLVALCLLCWFFVLRRARRIFTAASRVAAGETAVRLFERPEPAGRDELHAVAAEFDRMLRVVDSNEEQLRDSEAHLRAIIDTAHDAFVGIDAEGRIIDWNQRAEDMFGFRRDEALGLCLTDTIVPARYRAAHMAGLANADRTGSGPVFGRPVELVAMHRNGQELPVEITIWATRSRGDTRFNAFVRDITERRRLEEQLHHQAFHDPLTGLANRALFTDRVEHALAHRRSARDLAVLFLDLDDFKTVNDSLGHTVGDQLLLAVGERLRHCMRRGDTLARLAGDEFAALLEDPVDLAEAKAVADRILQALAKPLIVEDREVSTRASIGIAMVADTDEISGAELMRNADVAMYAAKRQGKATIAVFAASMHLEAMRRLSLTADLRQAIDRDEFVLHYQPYIDLRTNQISGFEALIRWCHPEHGLLPPGEFIPLAEETGLIVPIGRWALLTACQQAVRWQRRHGKHLPLSMSVNLSARQLQDPDLPRDLANALVMTGMDPALLTLEVTESVLLTDLAASRQQLAALKATGVRVALDDFGTGYSSLSYLQHLPIDVFKIDRSFVSSLTADGRATEMARAILQIGQMLRIQTVAEGVETSEQLTALQELGCDVGQGFLFSRPIPASDAALLLDAVDTRHRPSELARPDHTAVA